MKPDYTNPNNPNNPFNPLANTHRTRVVASRPSIRTGDVVAGSEEDALPAEEDARLDTEKFPPNLRK